jgi:hypothetical protein
MLASQQQAQSTWSSLFRDQQQQASLLQQQPVSPNGPSQQQPVMSLVSIQAEQTKHDLSNVHKPVTMSQKLQQQTSVQANQTQKQPQKTSGTAWAAWGNRTNESQNALPMSSTANVVANSGNTGVNFLSDLNEPNGKASKTTTSKSNSSNKK